MPANLKNSTSLTRTAQLKPQPKPPKLYTGTHPPTTWDPDFRSYGPDSGLTLADFKSFEAMPDNLAQVAATHRHSQVRKLIWGLSNGTTPIVTPDMTLAQVQAALDAAKTAVAAPFATEQSVLANIGKTVKTQDDVVRVFKEA